MSRKMNYFAYSKLLAEKVDSSMVNLVCDSSKYLTVQSHKMIAVFWLSWYRKFKRVNHNEQAKTNLKWFLNEIESICK